MEVVIPSWVSHPDVCRCCLSTSGSLDITTTLLNDGANEIFAEMLFDCYGIKLTHLSEWHRSRVVCSVCIDSLRRASSFKKQVLAAERLFHEYCTEVVTNKMTIPMRHGDGQFLDDDNCDYADLDEDDYKSHNANSEVRTKYQLPSNTKINNLRSKLKRHKTKSEGVAVHPILNVEKENRLNDEKVVVENEREEGNITDNVTRFVETGQPQLKQLSERKRITTTCETILKGTTACPFRHHKSWFQCFFCTQSFMEINTLREHTLTAHQNINEEIKKLKRFPRSLQIEISDLKCRRCDLLLTDVSSLCRHFVEAHKKVVYKECIADYKVNGSPYGCHLCERQFHVFRTLTTHLNEHYANCICDVCGKSYLNTKRLKVHKRTHEYGNYPCKKCGKVLKTRSSIANHMESAHSKRVIKCQICFKPMKHYNERVKHMSLVHNITHKFTCPFCSREYNIKHYLATHIRQTHGNKNKKCPECNMAFITNHGLKKHMLKHTGVKEYSCGVCRKSYARSYSLKEHMGVHESEKT